MVKHNNKHFPDVRERKNCPICSAKILSSSVMCTRCRILKAEGEKLSSIDWGKMRLPFKYSEEDIIVHARTGIEYLPTCAAKEILHIEPLRAG